jgi:hypothetical protein
LARWTSADQTCAAGGTTKHNTASTVSGRIRGRIISHDATIGFMAKFRPIRANAKKTSRPQGAAGCVILILLIMVGVMVFLYLVMKSNANG